MSRLPKKHLIQGNEACVQGAFDAGVRFFAGYPITPSTEILEGMAERLPGLGGKFIQMEDEMASIAAVIGASMTGEKAMTATSGPGFSLMQENIGYAVMTEIPCVIVNVQRFGPSTGLPTSPAQGDVMQARWGTHGDHPAIVLTPWSVEEVYRLTVKAINLAERFRTPVILLLDEVIAHLREGIEIPNIQDLVLEARPRAMQGPVEDNVAEVDALNAVPPMKELGRGFRCHYTGLVHDPSGNTAVNPQVTDKLIRRLSDKVQSNLEEIIDWETIDIEDADTVIVAYGCTARSAMQTLKIARTQGLKVGLLRLISLWPFPEEAIDIIAEKRVPILVPEMNLGQIVLEVERVVAGRAKVKKLSRVDGKLITPDDILSELRGEF